MQVIACSLLALHGLRPTIEGLSVVYLSQGLTCIILSDLQQAIPQNLLFLLLLLFLFLLPLFLELTCCSPVIVAICAYR